MVDKPAMRQNLVLVCGMRWSGKSAFVADYPVGGGARVVLVEPVPHREWDVGNVLEGILRQERSCPIGLLAFDNVLFGADQVSRCLERVTGASGGWDGPPFDQPKMDVVITLSHVCSVPLTIDQSVWSVRVLVLSDYASYDAPTISRLMSTYRLERAKRVSHARPRPCLRPRPVADEDSIDPIDYDYVSSRPEASFGRSPVYVIEKSA